LDDGVSGAKASAHANAKCLLIRFPAAQTPVRVSKGRKVPSRTWLVQIITNYHGTPQKLNDNEAMTDPFPAAGGAENQGEEWRDTEKAFDQSSMVILSLLTNPMVCDWCDDGGAGPENRGFRAIGQELTQLKA
jgi:hypothetical protein